MRRPTVLVVDDDAFSRTIVSKKLKALAAVIEAEDGHDALSKVQGVRIDLAIVDLEMPRFNGLDLIKCMRGMPSLKHIPIIVLTANETRGCLEEALMGGATSFLLKPLNWSAFGEHICHVMELAYRAGHLALHDHLTGLPNRIQLNERLEGALVTARPGAFVATHMLDLDQFKMINDTMGHSAGDELLKLVADRLCELVRGVDTVARMGGDEFSIVQPGIARPADAAALAQRVIARVSEPYEIAGVQVVIGTTVGISIAATGDCEPEQELRNADVALYRAKKAGRGTFCFFDIGMNLALHERQELSADLAVAVEKKQFELFYQPVIGLETQRIKAFEALIRWRHPVKGLIQPGAFLVLAEQMGLILPIGEWVLQEACMAAQQWPKDLRVAVNLSPAHFRSPGLVGAVRRALEMSGLAPGRLEIEVTEAILLHNAAAALKALHELRAMGVRIAMDDFGTGYSSINHLQSFPFDKVKIDQSFVEDVTDNSNSLKIVRAVAALANGLGMEATAEGVETEEQLAAIRAEGCTEMQGFLSSEPVPVGEIPLLLLTEQLRNPDCIAPPARRHGALPSSDALAKRAAP
ncbi:MAG: EAL domain-containing protein [Hyphomicrobiaceae bacterium]|nr:EAL domain-containing protein [Hyphomicrobiaceae bacterium]